MVKNRDRLGIIASVLEAANTGSNKTRIMFTAKLSFKLLEKYLDVAVNAGFIQVTGSFYFVTDLGQEFLQRYSRFRKRCTDAKELEEALIYERETLSRLCERPGLDSVDGNLEIES